jgi:hypothetical protein
VVIVGERKDSQTYVRMKRKACEEVGIASFGADLPETASQEEVLKVVKDLNANPDVHGILVQLPVSPAPLCMFSVVLCSQISLARAHTHTHTYIHTHTFASWLAAESPAPSLACVLIAAAKAH